MVPTTPDRVTVPLRRSPSGSLAWKLPDDSSTRFLTAYIVNPRLVTQEQQLMGRRSDRTPVRELRVAEP
jgi:hypothetical protein